MNNDEIIAKGGGNYSRRMMEEAEDRAREESRTCDCDEAMPKKCVACNELIYPNSDKEYNLGYCYNCQDEINSLAEVYKSNNAIKRLETVIIHTIVFTAFMVGLLLYLIMTK
jgi:hypothetical protein